MKRHIIIVTILALCLLAAACNNTSADQQPTATAPPQETTAQAQGTQPDYNEKVAALQTIDEANALLKEYYTDKNFDAALAVCQRCIEIDPSFEGTYYMIAELHLLMLQQQYEQTNSEIANHLEDVEDKSAYLDWIQTYYDNLDLKIERPFTQDYATADEINEYGNSSGNMNNCEFLNNTRMGGLLASQGDWIYFADPNQNNAIYKMKTSREMLTKLNEGSANFLNVVGEYIYYCDINDNWNIYSMRTDGSEMKKIAEDRATFISVHDGWIYYCNESDEGYLYKIRTDGSERTKLLDKFVIECYEYDGWVYYMDKTGGTAISRVATDGSGDTQLTDGNVITFCIVDGWIYYMADYNGLVINKAQLDGSENQELLRFDGKVYNFNIYGNTMFVSTRDENDIDCINVINIDTMEQVNKFELSVNLFYTMDSDWLYFVDATDWNEWYRVNVETNETEKLK